ncbi:expressed protein, partial [Phakopsora pachyrhizi]
MSLQTVIFNVIDLRFPSFFLVSTQLPGRLNHIICLSILFLYVSKKILLTLFLLLIVAALKSSALIFSGQVIPVLM